MTENALRNRPPLGFMGDFVVSEEGIDLKLHGTTPFVDAARILALADRVHETNTVARLKAIGESGKVREQESEAWCHAYLFLMLLRMRSHQQQSHDGRPLSNFIDPETLDELDRRILKEAFRQARKLQSHIALEYQL
jgi:CBS domain-containing protein